MAVFGLDFSEGVDNVEWVSGKDNTTRSTHTPALPPPSTARSQVPTPRKMVNSSSPDAASQ